MENEKESELFLVVKGNPAHLTAEEFEASEEYEVYLKDFCY